MGGRGVYALILNTTFPLSHSPPPTSSPFHLSLPLPHTLPHVCVRAWIAFLSSPQHCEVQPAPKVSPLGGSMCSLLLPINCLSELAFYFLFFLNLPAPAVTRGPCHASVCHHILLHPPNPPPLPQRHLSFFSLFLSCYWSLSHSSAITLSSHSHPGHICFLPSIPCGLTLLLSPHTHLCTHTCLLLTCHH